jgi:hypothetical protein
VDQSSQPTAREMFQHLPFPFSDDRFPDSLGAVVQCTVLSGESRLAKSCTRRTGPGSSATA